MNALIYVLYGMKQLEHKSTKAQNSELRTQNSHPKTGYDRCLLRWCTSAAFRGVGGRS